MLQYQHYIFGSAIDLCSNYRRHVGAIKLMKLKPKTETYENKNFDSNVVRFFDIMRSSS